MPVAPRGGVRGSAPTARQAGCRCGARRLLAASLIAVAALAPAAAEEAPVRFSSLPGWAQENHAEAFAVFRAACPAVVKRRPPLVMGPADGRDLVRTCKMALALPSGLGQAEARAFFERNFHPVRIGGPGGGFLTGYYEPELSGSRTRQGAFRYPLYAPPAGIEALPKAANGLGAALTHARQGPDGKLAAMPDRAAIEAGALDGQGLELVWLADPVDAFFVHVQGSARIRMEDGSVTRYGFAARNGHPYTAVGKLLIDRGEIAREDMTADRLAAWLKAHPDEAPALMAANRSFIFFREVEGLDPADGPVGALGVPLVAGRNLAVDPKEHPLGVPVYVAAVLPVGEGGAEAPLQRLMVAADTGAAIRGPGRADVFFGSGAAAGAAAGALRHPASLYVLVPGAGDG